MTAVRTEAGDVLFRCDQQNSSRCERTLDTGMAVWGAAMDMLTKARWRTFPPRGEGRWVHCCRNCTVPR